MEDVCILFDSVPYRNSAYLRDIDETGVSPPSQSQPRNVKCWTEDGYDMAGQTLEVLHAR